MPTTKLDPFHPFPRITTMKTKTKHTIRSVKIILEIDEFPDTSCLGEYSNSPGPEDRTIDRQELGACGRNEYRYFIAAMSPEETGNPDSVTQDFGRMESLNRGDWCYIGIRAVAEVMINGTIQTIKSPGLWGIESDGDSSYLNEVGREELAQLRETLEDIGLSARAINAAFREVETIDA